MQDVNGLRVLSMLHPFIGMARICVLCAGMRRDTPNSIVCVLLLILFLEWVVYEVSMLRGRWEGIHPGVSFPAFAAYCAFFWFRILSLNGWPQSFIIIQGGE